ncbi:MAG: Inner membrane transport permease YbhR [Parcubacteria group bacterium ADurb.Bin305]|jgi:ABC-2 type transport system permease protein|nr:ABC transporter permease [Candidatus Paceibacterota bacterium]MDD3434401.1 ABC transporter permease [Candidatus Paceibacterota bacterium]OQA44499.1 MAG: Inner membrane transport permease YbhR [Parcubacteria group bacterium ADurb.Bin305]
MNSLNNSNTPFHRYSLKQRLYSLYAIWYREILIYLRNSIKVFTSIFLPILLVFFFSAGFQSFFAQSNFSYNFKEFFFSGILALGTAVVTMTSTLSIVWDKEFGFLREILVSPVPRSNIALGKILGAVTTSLIQGGILLALSSWIGIEMNLLIFIKTFIFICIFNIGVGALSVLIASSIQKTESFSIVLQVLIAPMSFLSGALFPLTQLPQWLMRFLYINPFTYGVDGVRWLMLANTLPQKTIAEITFFNFHQCCAFLILFDALMIILAVRKLR